MKRTHLLLLALGLTNLGVPALLSQTNASADSTSFASPTMQTGMAHTVKADSTSDIPAPPQSGVHLDDVFAPAVGNGVSYNGTRDILQMSSGKHQTGAIWGKSKLDLTKPFTLEGYIYLGNQGGEAADGMTLTFQNYGNNVLGQNGEGLGAYGRDIGEKRYSLEFDQYYNGGGYDSEVKPAGRHVAFVNGRDVHYHGALYVHTDSSWSDGHWEGLKVESKYLGGTSVNLKYTITDDKGNVIVTKDRDMNYQIELGTSTPYWGFTSSTGNQWEENALSFGRIPQQATINTRDTKIYKGQTWDPKDNLVSAADENGNPISLKDSHLSYKSNVNTGEAGKYTVTYNYQGEYQKVSASATVNVLERLTLNANDITINQGNKFNPLDRRIGLKAYDQVDGDLTDKIEVIKNDVDSSLAGAYHVTYQVRNSSGEVAQKTITVTVNPYNPWPDGNTDGWKMFSGEDIDLKTDPENSILESNKVFYADKQASIYKIYSGKDALKAGKKYKVTVYFKPLTEIIPLSSYRVEVALKADPNTSNYRDLINTTLDTGASYIKGYHSVTAEFTVGTDETNPLINVQNYQGGYIGSVSILPVN